MDRRVFIKMGLNLGALNVFQKAVPAWAAPAPQEFPDQFFIYIHFHEAWDISLFSDPYLDDKRPDPSKYFIEYRKADLISVGDRLYGPAIEPLKAFLPRMSVVNGLFMNASDIGHDGLASYMSTGGNGRGTVAGDMYAALSPNLLGVMTNSLQLPRPNDTQLVQFETIRNISGGALADSQTVGSVRVNGNLLENVIGNLGSQAPKFSRVRKEYEVTSDLTDNSDWATLVAAFRSGASSSAQISINSRLDTHQDHEGNHIQVLRRDFADVADLLRVLNRTKHPVSGDTLLSRTTIVMGSEFCRTPGLNGPQGPNERSGKDHNPGTNSALLMGPGIKGGTIVGASRLVDPGSGSTYLAALPISYDERETPVLSQTNSRLIRPTTLWRTVMESMNLPKEKIPKQFREIKPIQSVLIESLRKKVYT